MDATTKALLKKLQDLERQRWRINREIEAIQTALKLAGITPTLHDAFSVPDPNEWTYAHDQTFAQSQLNEACKQILKDYQGKWLTKAQVEYLVTRGGYKFATENTKNSVDVTLRRLAADGFCEAERVRGSRGNKYRFFAEPKNADA